MQIDIITCLPQILDGPLNTSIVKRAQQKDIIKLKIHNLRDYANDKHKKIDDYPYSGSAGMLLKIEPIVQCIEHLQTKIVYDEIIYMTPDGELLDQKVANKLSMNSNIIILCGHYKGIDYRVREHLLPKKISIGNYVLSGGELPAAVVVDSIVRLLPGVLSNPISAFDDIFQDNDISIPEYTRPYNYKGYKVPSVLLSGNKKKNFRMERKKI